MKNLKSKLSRRDVFKFGGAAAIAGSVLLGPLGPKRALASGNTTVQVPVAPCGGGQAIEAFPASPIILNPFTDQLPILSPLQPTPELDTSGTQGYSNWSPSPMGPGSSKPAAGLQDSRGGSHQIWPTDAIKSTVTGSNWSAGQPYGPAPLIYKINVQVATHSITKQPVRALKNVIQNGKVTIAAGSIQNLPASTIYGFNGTFPGPMIYAQYGTPSLVRFENHLGLDESGEFDNSKLDRCDFGAPDYKFLTHLHNGHTAPESDGNPNYCPAAYGPMDKSKGTPGEYVDNLYLNYPAGGDEKEKQSFFWFHDHRMDFTGANVYKGLVGIYPIYDPLMDSGDESTGFRLPGVPARLSNGTIDYTQPIAYDVPLVFYDCRLDDGVTPHKDFHNGCGETHPEWWGKTFFRHFPDHGFVGDVFTVNGVACPQATVDRRQYRFRLLGASISRIYDFKLMRAPGGVVESAGTDGQYLLPTGVQCMQFTEIAVDGGLLPQPVIKDSQQIWPAKRREVIVDFSRYMDGTPTQKGDVVYLVNVSKMSTGRMPDLVDPLYKVPMIKFTIGNDVADNSYSYRNFAGVVHAGQGAGTSWAPVDGTKPTKYRDLPTLPLADIANGKIPTRLFEFQRGSAGGEIQWLVNGLPFDPQVSMAFPQQGDQGELWTIRNGGGGWVHPVHFHMEEHRVQTRTGGMAIDDNSKEDVVALGPAESVTFYRRFRTFTGKYVAHCHNLAHEDHAMMFGWEIVAPEGITLTPTSVTVAPNGTQQFTAKVTGSALGKPVGYTLSPAGIGAITANGLYIAPAALLQSTSVTVTATSAAGKTATALVTISASVPATGGSGGGSGSGSGKGGGH